jgi:hypothetical protein
LPTDRSKFSWSYVVHYPWPTDALTFAKPLSDFDDIGHDLLGTSRGAFS